MVQLLLQFLFHGTQVVYFSSILGVSTLTYLPYCFFNLLSPICSIIIASLDWKMDKLQEEMASVEGQKTT